MHISNKCSIAVHCLVFLSEYGEREKVTSELLSCSTGCNPVTIRNILSALKKDEIITVKPGTGGAALALPPEKIAMIWGYRSPLPELGPMINGGGMVSKTRSAWHACAWR